jgi:hypothetical protein
MQNEHARPTEVPRAQPLAVWRLERTRRTHPLPRELARAAIAHYTDPSELVLVPKLRGGELLQAAAALGRRALPLTSGAAKAEGVTLLRRHSGAALVLAPLGERPSARRLEQVTARLLPLLRPGGFLVLAQATRNDAADWAMSYARVSNTASSTGSTGRAAARSTCRRWDRHSRAGLAHAAPSKR